MPLKLSLKPHEKFVLNGAVLMNGDRRASLVIENKASILREKDIMTPAQANTPAKRIYLAVQLMYTARDPRIHHETYFVLMRELVQAAPSTWPHIVAVSNHILAGEMYKALKSAKSLIAYEKEILDHATRGANLRRGRQADRKSA